MPSLLTVGRQRRMGVRVASECEEWRVWTSRTVDASTLPVVAVAYKQ